MSAEIKQGFFLGLGVAVALIVVGVLARRLI